MTGEADKWRRRERGLAFGIVMWALTVAIITTLRADAVAAFLVESSGLYIVGVILLSIGLCGGIGHSLLVALNYRISETDDLTEWDT